MNVFKFIYYLGVINIIFGFLWNWAIGLPTALLFAAIKFEYGVQIVKIAGSYLLVSLTTLVTLVALGERPNLFILLAYPALGAFILFVSYANNAYEAQKQALADGDWGMMSTIKKNIEFESLLMIGAVVFYVVSLFMPNMVINGITLGSLGIIEWALDLPVIGWIISACGVLFLLHIIFYGLLASTFLIGGVVDKFKKNPSGDEPKEMGEADGSP